MTLYIQNHESHAGYWIYSGYAHAWIYHGFQVKFINSLEQVNKKEDYSLMITDSFLNHEYEDYVNALDYIKKSKFCIMYCSPQGFPEPWGGHPNFTCPFRPKLIAELNSMDNLIKWNFSETDNKYFSHWEDIKTVPLAFDNINYHCAKDEEDEYLYDICFIGGFADNGFNEKIEIMKSCLDAFVESGLRCGFSVGQNISHQKENEVLMRSKVCLNIHDKYQRVLGLDANERTFKSLGANGLLISDTTTQLERLFPQVFSSNDEKELIKECERLISKDLGELNTLKRENRGIIEKEHSYIKRVEQLLSYAD